MYIFHSWNQLFEVNCKFCAIPCNVDSTTFIYSWFTNNSLACHTWDVYLVYFETSYATIDITVRISSLIGFLDDFQLCKMRHLFAQTAISSVEIKMFAYVNSPQHAYKSLYKDKRLSIGWMQLDRIPEIQ